MSRPGKIILGFVGTLIVLFIIAAVLIYTNLNRGLKYAVEEYGPSVTGTPISLNEVDVSPLSAKGEFRGLEIGNPEGFKSGYALKLDAIKLAMLPESLTADTVTIEEILVDGASLNAEFKGTQSNLQKILDNIKKYSGSAAEQEQPTEQAEPGKGKKFIVKEFRFTGGQVTASSDIANTQQTAKIPEIVAHNIGSESGGVTASELATRLLRPIIEKGLQNAKADVLKKGAEQMKEKTQEKLQEKLQGLMPQT